MKVVMIRHTRVGVAPGTCYGWSDVPLADTFADEARATAENLRRLEPFDAVFSSPLSRAVRLAEACGYDNPHKDDRLKEMNMGDWEMRRYDEIDDPHLQEWYEDYMNERTTNGECFDDIYRRVSDFLDELRQKDYASVAIFAHAGVLICGGIYARLFAKDNCFDHQTPYGGIQVMEI